jgi:hypothetical protein
MLKKMEEDEEKEKLSDSGSDDGGALLIGEKIGVKKVATIVHD